MRNNVNENALKVLQENLKWTNASINSANTGKKPAEQQPLHTIKSYVDNQIKTNNNFLRWLFNDYDNIGDFGKGMNEVQKINFKDWYEKLEDMPLS